MNFIDTHTHIYLPEFKDEIHQIIKEGKLQGVDMFFLPNIDIDSIDAVEALSVAYPQICYPMLGLHPCSVKDDYQSQLAALKRRLTVPNPYIAIGEIGLDLYWDKSNLETQVIVLKTQIEWAHSFNLPIVIHCREAFDELFEVLSLFPKNYFYGVLHCFTGNLEQARTALSFNLKLGIGGVSTYKNGGLDQVLPHLTLNDIILETDAPYLSPIPYRGKRNQPAYLPIIAAQVAKLMHKPLHEIAATTTATAKNLFNIR